MTTLTDLLATVTTDQSTSDNSSLHVQYAGSTYTLIQAVADANVLDDAVLALLTELVAEVDALNAAAAPPPG